VQLAGNEGGEPGSVRLASAAGRWVLAVAVLGEAMVLLEATVVNVALPSIQADLGFSQAGLAWVVNAYLIAFAGLLLLAGRLGDLAGRRNVFLTGLAVFTAASLACGLAVNQEMLIAARFAQGAGGALTSAVILGMIVTMFPGPREQAQAIGVFAFVASAGAAIGLLAGGILTQALNWHWIFFVNLPVGAATAIAAGFCGSASAFARSSAGAVMSPRALRKSCSILSRRSAFSRNNMRAFSRPCPSRSPL